jgi:hypothetical protein
MKRIFLILTALCIFAGASMKAQTTDYYTGKTEITGNNYTYKLSENNTLLILSNVKNNKLWTIQYWPNGEQARPVEISYAVHYIDKYMALNIFKEVFCSDEIAAFKSSKGQGLAIGIDCVVAPNGDIFEVEFSFNNHPMLKSINPDKFYSFELKLKEKLKYRIEERFKVLKYIQGGSYTIYFDQL